MNNAILLLVLVLLSACIRQQEKTFENLEEPFLSKEVAIAASAEKIWSVVTGEEYKKILGNEFDKGSFIESDWEKGSQVHFTYEPDKVVASGTITDLKKYEHIHIDYDFKGFEYYEAFFFYKKVDENIFRIEAGPYTSDYDAQIEVWGNYLNKVKEISEEL